MDYKELEKAVIEDTWFDYFTSPAISGMSKYELGILVRELLFKVYECELGKIEHYEIMDKWLDEIKEGFGCE